MVSFYGRGTSGGGSVDPSKLLNVYRNTTEGWDSQPSLIAQKNAFYIYTDYADGATGIKIGDGSSYLIDMPFIEGGTQYLEEHIADTEKHLEEGEREKWNSAVIMSVNEADNHNLVVENV